MSNSTTPAAKPSRSVMFGAAFLMATSAIGPGFLTQTSKFTATYGSNLIGVILLVICMDISRNFFRMKQTAVSWTVSTWASATAV